MVLGMVARPALRGHESEQARAELRDAIGESGSKERVVSAIVKDDEGANHEARGRQGQQQRKPIGQVQAEVHGHEEGEVGDHRIAELEKTSPDNGALEGNDL